MASTAALMVNNLCVQFGGLKAVDEVSFALKEQTLAGLIGRNATLNETDFRSSSL